MNTFRYIFFALLLSITLQYNSFAGSNTEYDTDTIRPDVNGLMYFFDLRDRETFVQLTNLDIVESGVNATAHIQIYDVSNNCNENDFFDVYTPGDTHTYNMRDIKTNDGNPSGVVLPDGAYGIVAVLMSFNNSSASPGHIGSFRIVDNSGYEYRTNALSAHNFTGTSSEEPAESYTFNFNKVEGVNISDVIGITLMFVDFPAPFRSEWVASNPIEVFRMFEVDILDLNENIFSCRNVIFSCVDEDNPLLEELLEVASEQNQSASNVASFEYGINEAIPHSKGGELLCPGNNISEGVVRLDVTQTIEDGNQSATFYFLFVGLSNGTDRGSMDSLWYHNEELF